MGEENKAENKILEKLVIGFLIIGLSLAIFNQFQLSSIGSGKEIPTGMTTVQAAVIPTGTPEIYGTELNIKYDDVNVNDAAKADQTIKLLGNFDNTISLDGANLERYISIASQMSCEYCCGAQSIIVSKEDVENMESRIQEAIAAGQITADQAQRYRKKAGDAACGCAHSFAMRGLAKYLITKHGQEFTDEQILSEMAKWKTLFFPTQMAAKAESLKAQNIDFSYSNLGSNKYRGIESGASAGGMVGGC